MFELVEPEYYYPKDQNYQLTPIDELQKSPATSEPDALRASKPPPSNPSDFYQKTPSPPPQPQDQQSLQNPNLPSDSQSQDLYPNQVYFHDSNLFEWIYTEKNLQNHSNISAFINAKEDQITEQIYIDAIAKLNQKLNKEEKQRLENFHKLQGEKAVLGGL
jgi:hypothetical protein